MNRVLPMSRKSNIVVQDTSKEKLIYDLTNNKVFCLNETSALIWQSCDGNNSISQISNIISHKLKTKVNEDFVWFALEQFKKENLLENDLPQFFVGLSRRETIKKVGLATLASLPVVTFLVAPLAVNAASTNCTACVKKNDSCSPACLLALGTCYDNAGCGGGQSISNVTCSQCKAGVVFAGGTGTGSWQGN